MNRRADWCLSLAALGCVALLVARAAGVFHQSLYVFTTGMEEESLFAIWKWVHHQPVYASAFEPPFAQSYFNWLFYSFYGAFCAAALSLAELEIPSLARALTLSLTVLTLLVVYQLLRPLSLTRRLAGTAIIACNPLVGFWSLTTRPDVGALAFGLLGLWCLLQSEKARSAVLWLSFAFIFFYCSWAFKQTYLIAFVATFLHFALARRWREAAWFGGATLLALALTVVLATPEYRYAAFGSQTNLSLLPSTLVRNASRALLKAPLFLFGLIPVVNTLRRDRTNPIALWAALSLPIMLVASAKTGASENYFFESAALCSILFLLEGRYLIPASFAQFLSPVLIATGLAGVLFVQAEPELALIPKTLAHLPGPVLVTANGGNLPWFQPYSPHFVVASTYFYDREAGKPFALGGIQGMLRSRQIAVLVCPRDQVNRPVDGVVPSSLRKLAEDARWVYFSTQTD